MNTNESQQDTEDKDEPLDGPAGRHINFDGIERASPLYPLEKSSLAENVKPDPEDLGLNSDGTNPGSEYEDPDLINPLTDLDEDIPDRDLLDENRDGYA